MGEISLADAATLLVLVTAIAGALTLTLALQLTTRRGDGFFRYFPFAVLLTLAVLVATSGRSLTLSYATQADRLAHGTALSIWVTRICSSFLLLASLERIVSYALGRNRSRIAPHWALLLAFIVFWSTTVASPALLAAGGSFSHDYAYTLLMGCAALLVSRREGDAAVAATRDATMLFLGASLALIPLSPTLAMEATYSGGMLPGVPRLAGLAPHAVALGMLAQLGLFCLYARPTSKRWLDCLYWGLGLSTLFLAQSKVSWLSFPIGAACIFWMRDDLASWFRARSAHHTLSSVIVPAGVLSVAIGLGVAYIFSSAGSSADSLFSGQQGVELATLTGRDRIWAVALQEWARHPVFGYGTGLFGDAYRLEIHMPFAVDGHNEFIDTLARSGLVGVAGLTIYATMLLVFSVKEARATRGLSLAIFVAIVFRSVSEVPLSLFGYGPEGIEQLLLLAILAGRIPARTPWRRAGHSPESWPLRAAHPARVRVIATSGT